MTCKKCIHFDVCDSWYKQVEAEGLVVGEMSQQTCEKFKNKSDVVEVVRCKDCKKAEELTVLGEKILSCRHWNTHLCEPTDFCSYGERKGD